MYQSRGLGQPYVKGYSGQIIDCSEWSNLYQANCWNPLAQTYSMLDFTTQSDLGPAASPATIAAVAADTQATIQQQCAQDPTDCAIASSTDPYLAALNPLSSIDSYLAALDPLSGGLPSWFWPALIGGGLLAVLLMVRR